ncbi:ribosome biogenesis GTP-binding protein YihA/YsxC [Chitinispirillales bacterium ANBcel5]|uniref:ribosome biogenesis GTP-binding protein YihA/YsxC n=1 Tax=Cellulosispirillum alkaliphilum TaxID=3039283 RepID=UPI002A5460D9|nr:ribosome biogenesis GTP-binding protein YihA/YsxC [Chitinispirillales bacterium ANBcel5]
MMNDKTHGKVKLYKAQFVTSAAHFSDLPPLTEDEYAVFGRSNVGKSSFINHVFSSGVIARTSQKPGKTTLANLYKVSDGSAWVDLPGYGYARASIREMERWSRLIGEYCSGRENLAGIIWLLDIRHPGIAADKEAASWLYELKLPVFPVLTKSDKLSRNNQLKNAAQFKKIFNFKTDTLLYTVTDHSSRERFWQMFELWRQENSSQRNRG